MRSLISTRTILHIIRTNLLVLGISMTSCIGVAIYYAEDLRPFLFSILIIALLILLLYFFGDKEKEEVNIRKREAFLAVVLSWILISLSGALPYLFSHTIPSVVDAVFESISGFTTTGSSILTDIESLPRSILFWRSMTHWIGGIGIIVIVIIIMPSLHTGGYHLFSIESSLQTRIRPRIKSTGKRLLLIYVSFTLLETLLLMLGGMSLFDSVCHSFGTVATGGFSTHNDSIAGFSPYIQYIIMIFMLLAGVNFGIYYFLFVFDFRRIRKNEEVRFYLEIILFLGLLISALLYIKTDRSVEKSIRDGFFQLISIVSCTGFATSDYILWPMPAGMLLFFAMFLGGSTGSTSGGIKMARHLVVLKNIRVIFRKMISTNAIIPLKLNGARIDSEFNSMITGFVISYLMLLILGSIVLVFLGMDLMTASSAVATCMAGIGPGFGSIGPMSNFAHLTPAAKIVLSGTMLAGRLEIYSLLVLFTPAFWKV